MSIVGTGTPTNRSNIALPNDVSQEILAATRGQSMVMRLARRINLPGRGVQIPVITADPTADWVTETGPKPVSNPTLDKKVMQAHKLAVIVPFSNEFRRDAAALYDELVARLPGALAKVFDATVFFGPGIGTSLANFDNFSAITQASLQSSVYGGLVTADTNIAEAGGIMNGIILSPQGKGMLLGALDGSNRPIFLESAREGEVPQVLGARTYVTAAAYNAGAAAAGSDPAIPDTVGIAGDWTHAMYGTVEGVRVDYSADATLDIGSGNVINLFQQNMFAVRAEIEVGFMAETAYFNALTRTHTG